MYILPNLILTDSYNVNLFDRLADAQTESTAGPLSYGEEGSVILRKWRDNPLTNMN